MLGFKCRPLYFFGFCCGLYCMMKLWVLYLAHSTCKYWALYTVHIFVLGFCSRRVCWVLYVDHLFSFLFQGFIYRPYYACLLGSWEIFVTHSPISATQVLFKCEIQALIQVQGDGGCLTRVTTAGFNKQNRQAVCEADVQKYIQYRLAAKKSSQYLIFSLFFLIFVIPDP